MESHHPPMQVVPYLRLLSAGIFLRRHVISSSPVHAGFSVTLRQDLLQVLSIPRSAQWHVHSVIIFKQQAAALKMLHPSLTFLISINVHPNVL
jgi:hypothetical protein